MPILVPTERFSIFLKRKLPPALRKICYITLTEVVEKLRKTRDKKRLSLRSDLLLNGWAQLGGFVISCQRRRWRLMDVQGLI